MHQRSYSPMAGESTTRDFQGTSKPLSVSLGAILCGVGVVRLTLITDAMSCLERPLGHQHMILLASNVVCTVISVNRTTPTPHKMAPSETDKGLLVP